MKNNKTLKNLNQLLADSYSIALKTQNYHWNIVGKNFKGLHELFGSQYQELSSAIDEIAERIRSIGFSVEATYENFAKITKIKAGNKNYNSAEMIEDLINDYEKIIKNLKNAAKEAEQEEDEATADLFISRTSIHEKTLWMLKSSR
jgi:starvation-inducible DNA-binding protein